MRSTIAIHTLTLTIAIVAVVFAVWPVVADAPWEDELVGVQPVDRTAEIRCEGALSYRDGIVEAGQYSSGRSFLPNEESVPGNPDGVPNYGEALAEAEAEIDRYC